MYEWRRDQVNTPPTSSEYRIISVAESDGGGYSCRGRRNSSWTEWSDITTLRVTVPIKPTVTLQPPWTQIYSGETISVRCEIQGGEGAQWTYEWRQDQVNIPDTSSEYRIIRVTESDSGGYSCRGKRTYLLTEWSDTITLSVSSKPKAELRADGTAVPVGGSVTLTCSVNPSSSSPSSSSSSGWKYYWYRYRKSYQILTNGQISVSEGGRYRCRGGRGEPVYYTEDSQSVRIDTTVSNRPVVTLYPNWSEIYRGETITVRCEIHGGDTEWDYEWETNSMIKAPNQNEYRIRSASSFNSGNYRCKGRMKSSQHETTEWSDSVTLTVSDNEPRPVLTVSPSWLSPGASVTLNCEVEHPSAGWSFYWYKAVPDLSEKSSSYELLPDGSGTAQDSYIIHGQTHTAGYVCRAGRGDPEYHTDHSQPKFVWSAGQFKVCKSGWTPVKHIMYADDLVVSSSSFPASSFVPSKPTVTLQPPWTQIYSGETVSVSCEIQGGEGAQWTYEWRPNKLNTPPTSSEYRIITVTESDSGGYSCRGTRTYMLTKWSDIITLSVSSKPKAELRADRTAVPVGGSVTLTCSVNLSSPSSSSSSSSSGWKYYWYRDWKSYQPVTNGQISVSEGGRYSCRGGKGEPVYYTEYSESVRIDTTVSNRPVVTLYPNWSEIYKGETITVRCEIHGGDTEWDYEWETNSIRKPPNQNEHRIGSASSFNSGKYRSILDSDIQR
ncbi:Fc receptor-like protein 5 [Neolamprologus brichardi]|uniref:Fc receptor-like protein 5 n=1 Tax=Neolamprologus brichardi TaxID=32507 RepID=UPI001643B8C9|nr:Fc receptor-like protein 5 [Neolamprologus brichardi]